MNNTTWFATTHGSEQRDTQTRKMHPDTHGKGTDKILLFLQISCFTRLMFHLPLSFKGQMVKFVCFCRILKLKSETVSECFM